MAPQREWLEKNFYEILGVPETAGQKDISRAYRKLARQFHPDTNPGNDQAEERFKGITAAYDVIGDEAKRKEYDDIRRVGSMGGGGNFRFEETGDLSDLFAQFFGGGARAPGGRSGARPRASAPVRGADLEAELSLSFTDSVYGVTTTIALSSEAPCDVCHGSGARPGTVATQCAGCNGRGVTDDNQGLFSFSKPCAACGGRGSVIADPCSQCRGTGVERRPREVKVRIPAGVDNGQRIRLAGRGAPGRGGGPAGDLLVNVRVEPDRLFGRNGANLTLDVRITFPEAALGADIRVPTLDGDPVTIRIPPGTRPGRTFRVKSRGINTGKSVGDLLVTVDIAVPSSLTAEEKGLVEALHAATHDSPREYLGLT